MSKMIMTSLDPIYIVAYYKKMGQDFLDRQYRLWAEILNHGTFIRW